jgi:hypothetical protein
VFERLRAILQEGAIDKRVQFMIEGLFALRKAGFAESGHPAVTPGLDLVEGEDQITHEVCVCVWEGRACVGAGLVPEGPGACFCRGALLPQARAGAAAPGEGAVRCGLTPCTLSSHPHTLPYPPIPQITLDQAMDAQVSLDVFKPDPEYAQREAEYAAIARELLGEESGSESGGGGSGGESSEEEDVEDGDGGGGGAPSGGPGAPGGGASEQAGAGGAALPAAGCALRWSAPGGTPHRPAPGLRRFHPPTPPRPPPFHRPRPPAPQPPAPSRTRPRPTWSTCAAPST